MSTTEQRPQSFAFLALSFLAMAVWPLLGLAACYPMFDKPTEAVLLFGGITLLLSLPIYMVIPLSEFPLGLAIIAIWLLTWLGPSLWIRPHTRRLQWTLTAILSGVSFLQAALGVLIILGKSA